MSAYCTLDDVAQFIPNWRLAADTIPSQANVTQQIVNISARLDAYAGARGYSLPITGTVSLALLKDLCLNGVAWYVGRIKFPDPTQSSVWVDYRTAYQQALDDLRTGALILPDAGTDVSAVNDLNSFAFLGSVAQCAATPYFTRYTVF